MEKKAAHNLEDSKATSWDDSIFVVKSLEQKRPICYAAYLTQWETGHFVSPVDSYQYSRWLVHTNITVNAIQ